MSDRVPSMLPLMERGVTYDEALHRITLGDELHDQGDALKAAASMAQELFCNQLDGLYPEDAHHPAYKDAVPKLDRAWQEFRASVAEAQRITEASR